MVCIYILWIFDIFKQLLLAVMILFFDSGYSKTIHPSYMFGNWQSIDSLPWVADLVTWFPDSSLNGRLLRLLSCRLHRRIGGLSCGWCQEHGARTAPRNESQSQDVLTKNHKKWQCKDLLVNSNQGRNMMKSASLILEVQTQIILKAREVDWSWSVFFWWTDSRNKTRTWSTYR